MWEGGKEVWGFVDGWDGLWLNDIMIKCSTVRSNNIHLLLLSYCTLQPGDMVIWLMKSLYSFLPFISIQHTRSPQTYLQSSHLSVELTTNSLYSSTIYILTHNVLLDSPGRTHKKQTKSQQTPLMPTPRLPSLVSFSYSHLHSFTLTHFKVSS